MGGGDQNERGRRRPLDTWRRYLQWTREAYPTGGHSLALLERCAFEFKDDARYADDLKYLHVWIEYASLVDDAEPLFQWLYDRRICQRHALFWESWAAIFEQQKRFYKTDQTFKRGIAMQAQPLWRLQRSQKSFDHRQVKLIRQQMLEGMAGAAAGGGGGAAGAAGGGGARGAVPKGRKALNALTKREAKGTARPTASRKQAGLAPPAGGRRRRLRAAGGRHGWRVQLANLRGPRRRRGGRRRESRAGEVGDRERGAAP